MNYIIMSGKPLTTISALEYFQKEEVMTVSNYFHLRQVSALWLWEPWRSMDAL